MNISDLKEGLKFKCKYMNEVKHGLIGVHRKGMEGECPILTIYDVKVSNSGIIHIPVYPPKGQDLEYFLDDNKITEFELLPEDNANAILETSINNIIKEPIFCSTPKKHAVSLTFINNNEITSTLKLVSATCIHEALGTAIEDAFKGKPGMLRCYNVIEVEEVKDVD